MTPTSHRHHVLRFLVFCFAISTIGNGLVEAQRIIDPIADQKLEQYFRWLRFDDSTAQLARVFHEEYTSKRRVEFLERLRTFQTEERELIERIRHEGGNPGELAKKFYPELERTRQALRAELEALDEWFFTQFESLLSDEQLPLMQRVRNSRAREQCQAKPWQSVLPETRVDLIDLLDQMFHETDAEEAVAAFILRFEPEYLEAMRIDYEARIQRDVDQWESQSLQHQMRMPGINDPEHERLLAAFRLHLSKSGRLRIAAASAFEESVRKGIRELEDMLATDDYDRFISAWRQGCFPTVFPDPASAESLYDRVLALEDLDDGERAAVELLRQQFLIEHERLSMQMMENRKRFSEIGMRSSLGYGEPLQQAGIDFSKLGESRYELCARQIDLIRGAVRPEMHEQFPEWDFEANPRRKPWDPLSERDFERRQHETEIRRRFEDLERRRLESSDKSG